MQTVMTLIDKNTGEETAPQVESAFPYRAGIDVVSTYPGRRFPWHWHGDVELFCLRSGRLEYVLPGGSTAFHAGDVGFVNAGVPHMTRAVGAEECRLQEHIFLPELVGGAPGSRIERHYVEPLLRNGSADILRVPADAPAAGMLRALLDRAFAAFRARGEGYEIEIRECMSRAWLALLREAPPPADRRRDAGRERVKAMLRFIEANCDQPISLGDIAAAANVGCREANRCFRRQLDMTPFEYLLDCRLRLACRLLRDTGLPVTQVGLRSGFSSCSYFGKLFRERFGCAPSAYRAKR